MRRNHGTYLPTGAGQADARPGTGPVAGATQRAARSARPRSRPALARTVLLTLVLAVGLAACADEPTMPRAGGKNPEDRSRTPPRTLGLVEITISGLGTGEVSSSALSAPTVEALERVRAERAAGGARGGAAPGGFAPQAFALPQDGAGTADGTIQLEPVSTGSFTDGVRGNGGVRYLWATYRVRNASDDSTAYNTERKNLTFYAVDTDSTLGVTAISSLERFNGSPADPSLASAFVPTGAARLDRGSGAVVSELPDVLQVLTEAEADAIQTAAASAGVDDVFPYGFVVQNPSDPMSRTLPANPAEDQFDGIVTFAFKVPLQASPADDPFTVSALFLAVDDDEVKLTQSAEEQTPAGRLAFDARADALGADVLTLLPPGGETVWVDRALRVLCEVRVAGPAGSPTTTLFPTVETESWLVIPPLGRGFYPLPDTVRLAVADCPGLIFVGAINFAVHGFQSGRNKAGTYSGHGTSLLRAPRGRNGRFFPGEEVEVTLTTFLGRTTPIVARYRVAVTGGSGTFGADAAYGVGDRLRSVALGDVDGDGDLDLATANSGNVSVLLNQGDGSFGPQATYGVGNFPVSVALGDLDGDGDLDLAVANDFSDDVSVLLNQGGGIFGSQATYAVGNEPVSVALGDVDGDGDLDLATANDFSKNVSVLANR